MPTKTTKKRLRLDETRVAAKVSRAAHGNGHAEERTQQDLTALEMAALHVRAKDKEFDKIRDQLQVGRGQQVDVTLRIRGGVDVGGEGSATVHEKLDTQTVMALLIASLPEKSRQKTLDHLVERCADWLGTGEAPVPPREAQVAAEITLGRLARPKQQHRRGTVSGSLSIEVLERGESIAKAA